MSLNINNFDKKDIICSTADHSIFKMSHKDTGTFYSSRISKKEISKYFTNEVKSLSNEVSIIQQLNHPSIIKHFLYSLKDSNDENYPTLITEYLQNGPLSQIIYQQESILDQTKKLIIIYGIASGMAYLHSHDILHCDLKPFNIWLDDHLFPKITGFNISEQICPNMFKEKLLIKGTPAYISPEIYLGKGKCKASDVYSFSLLVYEMMMNEKPYQEFNDVKQIQNEVGNNCIRPKFNKQIPLCYKLLIEKCWSQDPKERPTFENILNELETNSEFITDDVNEDEYRNYINFIKNSKITFFSDQKLPNFDEVSNSNDFDLFDESLEFKGIYETEANNLSFFLKHINYNDLNETNKMIGRNDYSNVHLIKLSEENYAIRLFNKRMDEFGNFFFKILNIYMLIDHPCLSKFIGFTFKTKKSKASKPALIVKFYHNGSLYNLLKKERRGLSSLDQTKRLIILYGVASGMAYLHSLDITNNNGLLVDGILILLK